MSMPYIPRDDYDDVIDSTEDSFTYVRFCSNKDGTKGSSRFLGKYMEVTVYSFKVSGDYFNLNTIHEALETKDVNLAHDLIDGEFYCYKPNIGSLSIEDVHIVSRKVVLNPEYDPEYWQQEYDACLKAISEAEKDGYRIY